MSQAADFFVSYTSADRAWAEWIAWQLQQAGFSVVVQAWDRVAGRDFVHEMHKATTRAKRTTAALICDGGRSRQPGNRVADASRVARGRPATRQRRRACPTQPDPSQARSQIDHWLEGYQVIRW
jgi:hypothetical protein